MCGLYGHNELLSAIVARTGVQPWEVADCFMCLLCMPALPLHRCDARSRREEHTEVPYQPTAKYSALHGACAGGRTDMLAWMPEVYPSVVNSCRYSKGEVSQQGWFEMLWRHTLPLLATHDRRHATPPLCV
jgi:hypothetical protein